MNFLKSVEYNLIHSQRIKAIKNFPKTCNNF